MAFFRYIGGHRAKGSQCGEDRVSQRFVRVSTSCGLHDSQGMSIAPVIPRLYGGGRVHAVTAFLESNVRAACELRHPRWPIRGVRGLQRLRQVDDRSSATALLRSDGGSGVCGALEAYL